jgi:hypothetical protein
MSELRELAHNKNETELREELREAGVPFDRFDSKDVLVDLWVQAKATPQKRRSREERKRKNEGGLEVIWVDHNVKVTHHTGTNEMKLLSASRW